jgi:lipid-A-disaccharide synthase
MSTRPLRIALVAGETSGDTLGAALIESLRTRHPAAEFIGMAGPRMAAMGCRAIAAADELAVMGLFEVVSHLPRLLRLRRRLAAEILAWQPDVFVGVDAPSFNLGLAATLKQAGLHTVQYVSPQLWAWRPGRVRHMHRACDLVLCLLPFEPAFYHGHGVAAEFVGHPLADQIPLEPQRIAARAALGLTADAEVLAVLPGSRHGEIQRMGPAFIAASRLLRAERPALQILVPMVSAAIRADFQRLGALPDGMRLLDGNARLALQAADAALVTSGTATLESLLCGCPLVAAYRFNMLTALLLKLTRMAQVPYFSLPNLLAGRRLVPEVFQNAVTGPMLAAAARTQLELGAARLPLLAEFSAIHRQLRVGGAERASAAVLRLVAA